MYNLWALKVNLMCLNSKPYECLNWDDIEFMLNWWMAFECLKSNWNIWNDIFMNVLYSTDVNVMLFDLCITFWCKNQLKITLWCWLDLGTKMNKLWLTEYNSKGGTNEWKITFWCVNDFEMFSSNSFKSTSAPITFWWASCQNWQFPHQWDFALHQKWLTQFFFTLNDEYEVGFKCKKLAPDEFQMCAPPFWEKNGTT